VRRQAAGADRTEYPRRRGFESAMAIVKISCGGRLRCSKCCCHALEGPPRSVERAPTRIILMAMLNWLLAYMVDHVQPDRVG
jgi:hypothetical protein